MDLAVLIALMTPAQRARARVLASEWHLLKAIVSKDVEEDITLVEPRLAPPRSSLMQEDL